MAMPVDVIGLSSGRDSLIKHAVGLLSQQIWCWGRDILRPEGNWLIEIGFDRMEPPKDHTDCTSVYTRQLATERRIVLRGFGVFYGEATAARVVATVPPRPMKQNFGNTRRTLGASSEAVSAKRR